MKRIKFLVRYAFSFVGSFGMIYAEFGGNTVLRHVSNILPVGTA